MKYFLFALRFGWRAWTNFIIKLNILITRNRGTEKMCLKRRWLSQCVRHSIFWETKMVSTAHPHHFTHSFLSPFPSDTASLFTCIYTHLAHFYTNYKNTVINNKINEEKRKNKWIQCLCVMNAVMSVSFGFVGDIILFSFWLCDVVVVQLNDRTRTYAEYHRVVSAANVFLSSYFILLLIFFLFQLKCRSSFFCFLFM